MKVLSAEDLRQRFVNGMSYTAATVNIVTTDGPAGRHGVTVSAMSSVSADTHPPTMLICVNKCSTAAEPIRKNGVFHVNVLRDDQTYLSDCFAGRSRATGLERFSCAQWAVEETGAPRILDPLVGFDCRLISFQEVGTHYVFYGAVHHVFLGEPGHPLIYTNRAYGTPALLQTESSPGPRPGLLRIGAFHTLGPVVVPRILQHLALDGKTLQLRLIEGDQAAIIGHLRNGTIDIALIYDWPLDSAIAKERLFGLQPYVLLPRGHPLASRQQLAYVELVDLPLVLLDATPSEEYFLSLFRSRGLTPLVRYRTRSLEMLRGLVGSGLGYAILVTHITSTTSYNGEELVTVPLIDPGAMRYVTLAYRRDHDLGAQGETFREACSQALQTVS